MNNKKKIVIIAALIAVLVFATVGATLAYFTDTDTKSNEFSIGNIDIAISEDNWTAAVEDELNENMYPGQIIEKDPVVTNSGSNPAFVRVSVSQLDQFAAKYDGAMIKYFTNDTEGALGEGWVKEGDYFYYLTALNKDEKTTSLFEKIQLPWDLTNDDAAEPIVVSAQAVQAQGFDKEITAQNLAEWFTTAGF